LTHSTQSIHILTRAHTHNRYNGGITTSGTVAVVVSVSNTETIQSLYALTAQKITIQGLGFGSSVLSDYVIEISGTGCSTTEYTPISRTSSTELIVSSVDLTGCTDTVNSRFAYQGTSLDVTSYQPVASIFKVTDTSTSNGLYDASSQSSTKITITGSGFVNNTNLYNVILKGSDSCTIIHSTMEVLYSSTTEIVLSGISLGTCASLVYANINFNGLGYVGSVAIGEIIAVSDTRTQVLHKESFEVQFTLTGQGFGSSSESDYSVDLRCSGVTVTGVTVHERLSSSALRVGATFGGPCSSYADVTATLTYKSVAVSTTNIVGKIDLMTITDTSTSYIFVGGSSALNITILGTSFLGSSFTATFTPSEASCIVNTFGTPTKINETMLIYIDVDFSNCVSGTISATVRDVSNSQTSSLVSVGTVTYIDTGTQGFAPSSSATMTLTGGGFTDDPSSANSFNILVIPDGSDTDCGVYPNSSYTPSVLSFSEIILIDVDLSNCDGNVTVSIEYDDASITASLHVIVGSIITTSDSSSTVVVISSSHQVLTVVGTGFDSNETSTYPISISDSESSASCGSSSTYVYPTTVSSTELTGAFDLSGCSGIVVFTLYYNGDTNGGVSCNIATVFSVTDTSNSQGIQTTSDQSISITGTGFYSSSTNDYVIWLSTDDDSCSSIAYIPSTVTSNILMVTNIDTTGCTGSPTYMYARVAMTGLGQLASVIVATFDLTSIKDTSTSQGVYAKENEIITITGIGFYDSDASMYDLSYTCESVTTSVSTSKVTYVSVDTMKIVADTSLCTSDVNVSMSYDGKTVSAISASIVSITDTKTTASLASSTGRTVTVTGNGFGSDSVSDYEISFISGGASSGCDVSSRLYVPNTRTSGTEIVIENVDTTNCTGILLASLNYMSMGALNTKSIATFAKIVDTKTSYGYSSLSSSHKVTLEGIGFSDSECSNYNISLTATNCSDASSMVNLSCSSVSYDLMIIENVSMLGCQGTLSASLTMPQSGLDLSQVEVGEFISVQDTSTVQVNTASADEVITIYGQGFESSTLSSYSVTLSFTSSASSSTLTTTLTPTYRASSNQIHVTANLLDATGVVSVSSLSLNGVKSIQNVDVSSLIKLSESYETYGFVTSSTSYNVSIQGEGFVSDLASSYKVYLSFGNSESICSDTTTVFGPYNATRVSSTYIKYSVSMPSQDSNCTYVYANLSFTPLETSEGYKFDSKSISFTNIATIDLVILFDTETTQSIQAETSFQISISGTGFFSSILSDYEVDLTNGDDSSCAFIGLTPSKRDSQLGITVTQDLSGCMFNYSNHSSTFL